MKSNLDDDRPSSCLRVELRSESKREKAIYHFGLSQLMCFVQIKIKTYYQSGYCCQKQKFGNQFVIRAVVLGFIDFDVSHGFRLLRALQRE